MSRSLMAILFLAATAAVTIALRSPRDDVLEGEMYRLDAAHSFVEFSVSYLGLMDVQGRFREWDAAILDPHDPTSGHIAVAFKTASLDTGNETRDKHLKSGDFFDVEAHPVAVFTSTRVTRSGDGYLAEGVLDLHGVKRSLTVPFRPAYAPTTDGKGNRRVGYVGEVMIDRNDFGVIGGNRFNAAFDPLVSIIGDEVTIRFAIHAMIAPQHSAAVDSIVDTVEGSGVEQAVENWNAVAGAGTGEEADRARARAAAAHNAAGNRMIEKGRHTEAIELMRIAVLGLPNSARAVSSLAEAYARAGQLEQARENVEKALTLDAAEARALVIRAWMAESGG